MLKKFLLATILAGFTSLPALAAPPAPPPALPAPKILVINRGQILQMSKVGQDIGRQVQALANQAKADMAAQSRALQAEGAALQQQVAILAPDAKQKKIDAFQAKEQSLQGQAQRKEAQIQGGLDAAQRTVAGVLEPILSGLMQQRGANMILDKSAVVFANNSAFDVTQAAIDQLNVKMSSLKVTLAAPGAPPPRR
jgi:Skp family chaperone for outer membrane proteins